MKNSLRFYTVLLFILFLILVVTLTWTTAVCLEQLWPCLTDASRLETACHDYLVSANNLIRLSIVIITTIGIFIPWVIFRHVIRPLVSIQNTIHHAKRGDMDARVSFQTIMEFDALAIEINQMLQIHQQEQEQWQCLHQTLTAVSAIRRMMLHESDENRLIQSCCDIFVKSGRYRMAQIRFIGEHTNATMSHSSRTIHQTDNPNSISGPIEETTLHPTIRALHNQHIAMINNIFEDSAYTTFQADAKRFGYASVIAVPIVTDSHILGALTLYAEKPDAFSAELTQLLMELADDLGRQIQAIRFSFLTKYP